MILVRCTACSSCFRLMQDECMVGSSSEFWPDKYVCPSCGAAAQGMREDDVEGCVDAIDIEPTELYAAMHGLGLPSEMVCEEGAVVSLLTSGISRVVGFMIPNTTRFVLEHLVTADGTRVFFGSCPHGAVVYRIARKPEYARKILEGADD